MNFSKTLISHPNFNQHMEISGEERRLKTLFLILPTLFFVFAQGCEEPKSDKKYAEEQESSTENRAPAMLPGDTVKAANPKTDSVGKTTDPVALKAVTPKMDTSGPKFLYLTFDDGPNPGTRVVLDILRQENVPATFFIIGLHAYGSPMQKKLLEEMRGYSSVQLANHSYTHGLRNRYEFYYNHPDTVLYDFKRNADSLHFNNRMARTPSSNIWRLPTVYGDYFKRRKAAADLLAENGFMLVGWDWEWTYNSKMELKQTAEQLASEIDAIFRHPKGTKIPNHLVLLAHDHTFTDATDSTRLHHFVKLIKASGKYHLALLKDYPWKASE